MSEQEFELYLSLLSKLLKLDKNQRAEISDEMRDHLEARFDDLVKQGHDRRKAIELALDEFGDANVLAGEFSQLAIKQRRRKIMRLTFGTIITSACLILAIQSFWPEAHVPNQNRFVTSSSQADEEPKEEADPVKAPPTKAQKEKPANETTWIYSSYSDSEKKIEEQLNEKIPLEFEDATLEQVVDYLRELKKLPIIIKTNHLEDEGIDPDGGNITFVNEVSLRSALNLMLEPLGLTYRIENEVLIIDTKVGASEEGLITRVYNCRDLLSVPAFPVENDGTYYDPNGSPSRRSNSSPGGIGGAGGGAAGFGGGGGGFSVQDQITSQLGSAVVNQLGAGAGTIQEPVVATNKAPVTVRQVPPKEIKYSPSQVREKILIDVIQKSTGNYSTWNPTADLGQGGSTIQAYFGMIILTAPESLHREVVELLEMLRESFRRDNLLNEELSRHNRGYKIYRYNAKTGTFDSEYRQNSTPSAYKAIDDDEVEHLHDDHHSHGNHSHDDDNDNDRRGHNDDDHDHGKPKPKKE